MTSVGDIITTAISTKQLGDDGILRVVILPDAVVTRTNIEEDMAAYPQLIGGQKRPVLVDIRGLKSVSRSARQYGARAGEQYFSAAALLVGSPVTRMIGNFFLGFHKPALPLRVFTSEKDAMQWLMQFVENPPTANEMKE